MKLVKRSINAALIVCVIAWGVIAFADTPSATNEVIVSQNVPRDGNKSAVLEADDKQVFSFRGQARLGFDTFSSQSGVDSASQPINYSDVNARLRLYFDGNATSQLSYHVNLQAYANTFRNSDAINSYNYSPATIPNPLAINYAYLQEKTGNWQMYAGKLGDENALLCEAFPYVMSRSVENGGFGINPKAGLVIDANLIGGDLVYAPRNSSFKAEMFYGKVIDWTSDNYNVNNNYFSPTLFGGSAGYAITDTMRVYGAYYHSNVGYNNQPLYDAPGVPMNAWQSIEGIWDWNISERALITVDYSGSTTPGVAKRSEGYSAHQSLEFRVDYFKADVNTVGSYSAFASYIRMSYYNSLYSGYYNSAIMNNMTYAIPSQAPMGSFDAYEYQQGAFNVKYVPVKNVMVEGMYNILGNGFGTPSATRSVYSRWQGFVYYYF